MIKIGKIHFEIYEQMLGGELTFLVVCIYIHTYIQGVPRKSGTVDFQYLAS